MRIGSAALFGAQMLKPHFGDLKTSATDTGAVEEVNYRLPLEPLSPIGVFWHKGKGQWHIIWDNDLATPGPWNTLKAAQDRQQPGLKIFEPPKLGETLTPIAVADLPSRNP